MAAYMWVSSTSSYPNGLTTLATQEPTFFFLSINLSSFFPYLTDFLWTGIQFCPSPGGESQMFSL